MADESNAGFVKQAIAAVAQRPFTELMALILAASIIGYAYYDLNIGRPDLVKQIHEANTLSRSEYKEMNRYTIDTFNAMMQRQEASHERVLQMVGGDIAAHRKTSASQQPPATLGEPVLRLGTN